MLTWFNSLTIMSLIQIIRLFFSRNDSRLYLDRINYTMKTRKERHFFKTNNDFFFSFLFYNINQT